MTNKEIQMPKEIRNPKPEEQTTLEVLFAPAEFAALEQRDLSGTVCVVFDVLRATSSMVTALANGAAAVVPVAEISEALKLRDQDPRILLAGERDGLRIKSDLTGSVGFDLGNSPREFTREKVNGKTIAMTTTNGTRALRACARAKTVLAASFLNLRATVDCVGGARDLILVCSGTLDQTAYEDLLGAGAICDLLWPRHSAGQVADSAQIARQLYLLEAADLFAGVSKSRNGRRLLANPDLREDVAFCVQPDIFTIVAELGKDGAVRASVR
jgi:2-phosphosulfolactate phosphatase